MAIRKTVKNSVKAAVKPVKAAKSVKATKGAKKNDNLLAERPGKIITREGNIVLKAFEKAKAKADVLNEALNQSRVEQAGLPVPSLKEVRVLKDGRWAIAMDYVEGQTLEDLMTSDKKNFAKYMKQFIDIHVSVMSNHVALLNPLREKLERQLGMSELPEEQRYNLHMQLSSKEKKTNVCHGDFNPSNVILLPGGGYKIIDWAHARRGNPLADVARTYLYFWVNGRHDAAEKYLVGICNVLKVQKHEVQLWLPIVAAAQSTKTNDSRVRDLLLHWASVVDYV